MSAVTTIADMPSKMPAAYALGVRAALSKLGTEAGPIAYSPRFTRDRDDLDEDNLQYIWAETDREPFVTGDESAIGMPSPGGAVKNAGLNDGGFSEFSSGVYGSGGVDADRKRVDKDQRISSAIQNAYDANENYDQSYGPESAATQPHGSKYATALERRLLAVLNKVATAATFGAGASLKGAVTSPSLNPTANARTIPARNPQQDLTNMASATSAASAQGAFNGRLTGAVG